MSRISLYRSLVIAASTTLALGLAGCADANKKHETMRQEQYNHWNMTRVGVMYQLAEQQYAVGEYDKCRETLAGAMALKAQHAPLYTLAAKVELENGSLDLAAGYLKSSVQIDPANPEPYYLLGVVYQRWQKSDVAHDYYQQAWDRKPNEPLYLLAVTEMKITLGRIDEAQKLLEDKMVYFEQTAALRVALARVYVLKGDYDAAAKYYREATVLLPDDQSIRRSYAETLFFSGHYAQALPILEDLHKRSDVLDKESTTVMLGQTYLNLRRPQDARNILQEVCRDHPNNIEAYLTLGKACIQTNDLQLAISAGRRILKIDQENVQALIIVALVQQKQKNWADAQITLVKAERIAPTDSTVLCMLGISAQQLGQKDTAAACFSKAVEANPKDTWAQELLATTKPVTRADEQAP